MAISLKKAALINAASRYTSIMLNLGFTMILARILTPEDYGIVAVTVVFTNFFSIFADMGISNGIIQYKKLTAEDIASIFSLTGVLGVLLSLAFFVFSFGIASFYNNEVYVPLGALLAVNLLLSTWNIVPNALLLKDKQFILMAKRNIWIPFSTSMATVVMALAGMAYYALVLQSVLAALIMFAYNWYTTRRKYDLYILWELRLDGLRKIFGYSAYQFLFSVINYFARNLDNLLIGRFWGAAALGFYDKAYRLSCYPNQMLSHVITPVLQPILSDYQDDKKFIYDKYVKVLKFLSLTGVFICLFLYSFTEDVIYILYGEQWNDAVPYLKLLALSIWAQMILSTTGSIFQSTGNTKQLFITGCITTLMMVTAILLGAYQGEVIHLCRNIMVCFNVQFFIVMYLLISRCLKQPYWPFLRLFMPEIIIGMALRFLGYILYGNGDYEFSIIVFSLRVTFFSFVFLILCFLLRQWHYLNVIKR